MILMLRCMDVSCVGTGRWKPWWRDPARARTWAGIARDMDPAVKTVEIIAFLHGMETSWLFDPSVPLTEVFR